MKSQFINLKVWLTLLGVWVVVQSVEAQDWRIEPRLALKNKWDVNVNLGMNSFYGDISSYDDDMIGKLQYESGFAGGVIVTKRVSDIFGLSGQVVAGSLSGRKNNIYIHSKILEYNLHLRMDLVPLFTGNSQTRLKLEVFGGVGNFIFDSSKEEFIEGESIVTERKSRVPEFLYLIGGGLGYNLSPKISISSEISVKQCQNDKIDLVDSGTDYDYYTYLNIGITYHFRSLKQSPLRNKARIAHSNWFQK